MEDENKYEVAGKKLKELLVRADRGEINEAENFLLRNQYSLEEVIDGMKQLMRDMRRNV